MAAVVTMARGGFTEVTNTKQNNLSRLERKVFQVEDRYWFLQPPCEAEGGICEVSRIPVRSLEGRGLLVRTEAGGSLLRGEAFS